MGFTPCRSTSDAFATRAKKVQRLRELEHYQRTGLRSGSSTLIRCHLVSPKIQVLGSNEPYICMQFQLNNSSVFNLAFDPPRFQSAIGGPGEILPLAATLASDIRTLNPGGYVVLTFNQPITQQTLERINEAKNERSRLALYFKIEADFTIQETGDRQSFKPGWLYRDEIPW